MANSMGFPVDFSVDFSPDFLEIKLRCFRQLWGLPGARHSDVSHPPPARAELHGLGGDLAWKSWGSATMGEKLFLVSPPSNHCNGKNMMKKVWYHILRESHFGIFRTQDRLFAVIASVFGEICRGHQLGLQQQVGGMWCHHHGVEWQVEGPELGRWMLGMGMSEDDTKLGCKAWLLLEGVYKNFLILADPRICKF